MAGVASQLAQLEFLTKLQHILGEGQFVASYKFALLLALAELSVENAIRPDGPPQRLSHPGQLARTRIVPRP